MNDMHRNWKKRWKAFWNDAETHVLLAGSSIFASLIGTGVVDSVVGVHDFSSAFYTMTLGILTGSYATLLGILAHQKESAYDRKEDEYRNSLQILEEKIMEEVLFPEMNLAPDLLPLLYTISNLLQDKRILEREKEYLTETLPKQILHVYTICEQAKQQEKEKNIIAFRVYIQEKYTQVKEIQRMYQNESHFPDIQKIIEEEKQEKYEKLYVTD